MSSKKLNIPSVLLFVLSALGILIGVTAAVLTLISTYGFSETSITASDEMTALSTSVLLISIGMLNVPTLITSIKKLQKKPIRQSKKSLLQKANYFLLLWLLIITIGFFISREENKVFLLAPLTVAAVFIPVWWLIEFSRRGLPRSTKLREWGTLTIGLTITPIVIISIELLLTAIATVAVTIRLGFQPNLSSQLHSFIKNINQYQGGIVELEQILYEIMKQPIISTAIFLILGLIAPLIEEIFKPMSTWFLLSRPLEEFEGFSLGLISGGAFAILESAGIVIQTGSQDWLIAIVLRAATGVLHIGLSGLVGYGLARSWRQKKFVRGVLYIITATILHGVWNSMSLLSGFSSSLFNKPGMEISGISSIISLIFIIIVFVSVIAITLSINSRLRQDLARPTEPSL